MNPSIIAHVLGIWLLLFSGSLLPPLIISLLYHDGETLHFSLLVLFSLISGLVVWLASAKHRTQLRTRDGFIIVVLLWLVTSLLGMLPFIFGLDLSVADALFESVSAFTTTGATVITGLDDLPPSILFFRQEMQWLGGIGVVVSAIALLPMLGIGGMQMFKAETPGPMKDEKLTPRIAHTAQALWKLYLVMTLACALLYWAGGMSLFDAVAHSLTTVSTGGFSTHDASLGYFDSVFIENVATLFMLLGGISFSVHFLVWKQLSFRPYWQSVEVRVFLLLVLAVILVTSAVLYFEGARDSLLESLRYASFTVASVVTSTGFGIDDFSVWPTMLPLLLILISFVGGCAGSTAGGMKVIRFVIMGKGAGLEIQRLMHPSMIRSLQLQGKVIDVRVADAVRSFFSVYVATFVLFMLFLMGQGLDHVTAFSAVATCMNNLGPGLGDVASNFQSVSDSAKWILSFAMLLGRLEIFTLLVVLSPAFWRR
ncbi:TrkH family potassium uptake protein [Sedimenticola hydrogenitrophicus]|uniref:TrkH family potassium uptake protein n=1 Tax=Sedimenticola hydrogenitrophicus TaxID=2967975 RepID=UPI0023B1B42C|nr:TrkH family potassium uptake protein [Sedimenticola hydrogenitrophicus]